MPVRSKAIADIVKSMLADGAAHEAIVHAVEAAERRLLQERGETTRGTRLPADWEIPNAFIAHAAERGMPTARIHVEAERFKNYWTAKSGQGAIKRDWF